MAHSVTGLNPLQYLWIRDLQIRGLKATTLAAKRLGGVTSEVNLGNPLTKHASEGSTLALKPRADVTRCPKQEYQWPYKKTYVLNTKTFRAISIEIFNLQNNFEWRSFGNHWNVFWSPSITGGSHAVVWSCRFRSIALFRATTEQLLKWS